MLQHYVKLEYVDKDKHPQAGRVRDQQLMLVDKQCTKLTVLPFNLIIKVLFI